MKKRFSNFELKYDFVPSVLIVLLLAFIGGCRQPVRVLDLDGNSVNPLSSAEEDIKVFVFTQCDCPVANRYAPAIKRLHEEYKSRGVNFYLVYPDPDETAEEIRSHLSEYTYQCDAYRDPQHRLVAVTGAICTPEAAVFNGDNELVYRGRIDNQWVDFGKARLDVTQHDLKDAIEAVLTNQPVGNPRTKAVGCYIADLAP